MATVKMRRALVMGLLFTFLSVGACGRKGDPVAPDAGGQGMGRGVQKQESLPQKE